MINIAKYQTKKLSDVSNIERAKKNKVYPKDTILIQVSASKGQVLILEEDLKVESKYACVIANEDVDPYYLFSLIEMEINNSVLKYMTGINIQMDTLSEMELRIHEYKTQKYLGDMCRMFDSIEKKEMKIHEGLENLKKDALDKMFV